MLRIADVLDARRLAALTEAAADLTFEDGRKTAGWAAATVKHNLQAAPSKLERGLIEIVEQALLSHPVFVAWARPKALVRTRFSRYEPGMNYGWHTDDAIIEGQRTDLSFTLFLSPPEAYDGGALVIEGAEGESEIRLPAGGAVVYPATAIHRVTPVTRGGRLVAFGWVRSFVRRADQRAILFDLELAARDIYSREGKSAAFDRLANAKANLLRMWATD